MLLLHFPWQGKNIKAWYDSGVEKWPNSCWLIAKLFVQARLLASAAERDTELESSTQVPRLLQPATWISVEEETHVPKQLGNMEEFQTYLFADS